MRNRQVAVCAIFAGAWIKSHPASGLIVVPVSEEPVKGDNVLHLTTLDPRLEQLLLKWAMKV